MKRHIVPAMLAALVVGAVSAPCRAQIPPDLRCAQASEKIWKTWSETSLMGAPPVERRPTEAAFVVSWAFKLKPEEMEKQAPEFNAWAKRLVVATWEMGMVSTSHPPDHEVFTSFFTGTCNRHFKKG